LVVGTGGIYAEMYKDLALGTIPISKEGIKKLLQKTKIYKAITGYRNKNYDLDFLIETLYSLTQFAYSFRKDLVSLDINPLILKPKGGKIVDFKVYV